MRTFLFNNTKTFVPGNTSSFSVVNGTAKKKSNYVQPVNVIEQQKRFRLTEIRSFWQLFCQTYVRHDQWRTAPNPRFSSKTRWQFFRYKSAYSSQVFQTNRSISSNCFPFENKNNDNTCRKLEFSDISQSVLLFFIVFLTGFKRDRKYSVLFKWNQIHIRRIVNNVDSF